ncbi:MAG TPA: hypothetical protein VMH01_06420 [Puia sp.]|nr:hypothetical protein [Puia sp.]
MLKYLFPISFIFFSLYSQAQTPEDALRLSWTTPSGTARQQAIGGAMGSLGGEISALFVNPAGMGFYKTSEMVVSPGFRFQSDNSDYRGTNSKSSSAGNFNIGTSGFVFGFAGQNGNSTSLSIAVDRTASFGNNTYYQGQNDYSSFSEQYAEEFANSGLSINDAINSPSLSYGTRMALYTYLIDTATINGVTQVIGQPQKVLNAQGILDQLKSSSEKGGATEISLGVAGSSHDKWYFGVGIGVPIVKYTRDLSFTESDASGNTNNDFATSTYTEHYTSSGAGVNAKLGVIFKPSNTWRIGLAVHTPSFYVLTDNLTAAMTTNTENYAHLISITSADLDQNSAGSFKYNLQSPWKIVVSGSYIFGGGVENVKEQKGFITADIEYDAIKSSKFSSPVDDNGTPLYANGYFDAVNSVIKSYYKNNFNFRMGGELKLNIIAARAGLAYSMTPYSEKDFAAHRIFLSGGIGYRNKGIFADLTYVETISRDVDFPYRLADKSNTYAAIKQFTGTVILTVGVKF